MVSTAYTRKGKHLYWADSRCKSGNMPEVFRLHFYRSGVNGSTASICYTVEGLRYYIKVQREISIQLQPSILHLLHAPCLSVTRLHDDFINVHKNEPKTLRTFQKTTELLKLWSNLVNIKGVAELTITRESSRSSTFCASSAGNFSMEVMTLAIVCKQTTSGNAAVLTHTL